MNSEKCMNDISSPLICVFAYFSRISHIDSKFEASYVKCGVLMFIVFEGI